jgi:phosphoglycerate dehydrogenase-like enzyme
MTILIHFDFSNDQIDTFIEIARNHGGHTVLSARSEADAVERAADAEALIGYFTPAICAAAPNLKWIQSYSAGMDNFLFPEIVAREDVVITSMAGLYAPQGGEHTWAMLLALTRGIPQAVAAKKDHRRHGHPVITLVGATLGVIGMGGFGAEIVKRSVGYGMKVIAVDPVRTNPPPGVDELKPASTDNLHDLLRRSDAVILACPRTPDTYHLINAKTLELMKPTAYLINVTRGGIVDESALAAALSQGQIAGAALDVTEEEPLPEDSPLWDAPNLILTPHNAGMSQHRPRQQFEFFCEQLEHYLKGHPLRNVVNTKLGF